MSPSDPTTFTEATTLHWLSHRVRVPDRDMEGRYFDDCGRRLPDIVQHEPGVPVNLLELSRLHSYVESGVTSWTNICFIQFLGTDSSISVGVIRDIRFPGIAGSARLRDFDILTVAATAGSDDDDEVDQPLSERPSPRRAPEQRTSLGSSYGLPLACGGRVDGQGLRHDNYVVDRWIAEAEGG